ncbi:predicted membrane protein hemolysin III homolog [Nonlabens ulvanivorans]|uniref:Predicted membrane protein hemolysin III homolog n=1 Tax=Nonlabens ulvanivorans TaxID=906888 RepID=A0A090X2Y1_NONUL|nr:hemolysin III family protein [Nonlabens ulvanivorans]GAL75072.1 predicted membrane protein hemolysin III homolog [Nonlabens ulvanivorans]
MARAQSPLEEKWNVITHGFGFLLALIGAVLLFLKIENSNQAYIYPAIIVYAFSQIFLYFSSTYYHWVAVGSRKDVLRKMDHIAIYGSIAGTYTPMCLLMLQDSNGWMILYAVWGGIALFGLVWKLFFTGKYEAFSSILYLVMGWLIVLDLESVQILFTDSMIFWLIAGGVFFTVGIIFYAWNKLYFNHVIWHLFVLGGSISHFLMVLEVVST